MARAGLATAAGRAAEAVTPERTGLAAAVAVGRAAEAVTPERTGLAAAVAVGRAADAVTLGRTGLAEAVAVGRAAVATGRAALAVAVGRAALAVATAGRLGTAVGTARATGASGWPAGRPGLRRPDMCTRSGYFLTGSPERAGKAGWEAADVFGLRSGNPKRRDPSVIQRKAPP